MSDPAVSELRPAYRTLNEPTRLLGVSLSGWIGLLVTGGIGYAFLTVSPLPWRLNFSAVVIGLGAPALLLILRESGTVGPGRLLTAVVAWRARPTQLICPGPEHPVLLGGIRLDVTSEAAIEPVGVEQPELPWTAPGVEDAP